ncbi:serine/threonine-protein kinase [Bacillus timonensis]|uniref:Serine/threonine-protein kinase n=1 Tax=Bacillus timonensis TaxID=1033734 RepID=A0A4S3PNC1_9BACI|nr:protein kinase [Bacillus timonensis]THE11009.1 serine/threonine-protein kinase [Bacillus timonensis]
MLRPIRRMYQFIVDKPIKAAEILNHRYQVIDMIGTGSYGIVYLCHDLQNKEYKVVKQLRPSKRKNRNEIKLFEDEISIMKRLKHKQMPLFYGEFSERGHYFYAMSYMDGVNLEDEIFLNKKVFNEEESLLFLAKIIKLVDYLHNNDMYHLDLRIPNIIIKENEPYLIDFGLARQVKSTQFRETNSEELKLQDYYDLGDILLYLLYTTYPLKTKKALPWTEELSLRQETEAILKKLLGITEPYSTIEQILHDLYKAVRAFENSD